MSFQITLGINHSENNKITKEVETTLTTQATLRDTTSIIDPILELIGSASDYAGYNYLEIPTFKRKYFIRNIKSVRNGLVSIECHCDVLSSFATAILSCSGIVGKNAERPNYNLYLNDGTLKVNQYANYRCYYFPNGFTTQEFILAVAGG